MNKKFALSTLSLAIVIASGSIQAETPQECITDNGNGETMKEWGIWCGVETFLTSLTEQEPAAAGPAETDVDIVLGELGRGDAEEFDPNAETNAADPVIPDPVIPDPVIPEPEPEPEPEPITPHITLNEQSRGYVASYDLDFPDDIYGEGQKERSIESFDEGERTMAVNPRVGTLSLSLNDNCQGCDYYYNDTPDTGSYVIFNQVGEEEAQADYEDNGYTPLPGGSEHQNVSIDSDSGETVFRMGLSRRESRDEDGQQNYLNQYSQISGGSVAKSPQDSESEHFDSFLVAFFGEESSVRTEGPIPDTDAFGITYEASGLFRTAVQGTLTPQVELDNLLAGQVSAIYGGTTGILRQRTLFEVDFGDRTFDASFGDANFGLYRYEFGINVNPELFGAPDEFDFSFNASGVIEGTELISTSVSSDGAATEGFVQGSFFEAGAQAIGGAYKITKQDVEYADAFGAIQGFTPEHIQRVTYRRGNYSGYYADTDFEDGELDRQFVGAFDLNVSDSDFSGYAGDQNFYGSEGFKLGDCSTTDRCSRTFVDKIATEDYASSFQKRNQNDGVTFSENWNGYEPTVSNDDETQVLKDYWNGYYTGQETDSNSGVVGETNRTFVAGIATPISDINQLISDNTSLVYSGNSLNLLQSARVVVNFGDKSYQAQFGDMDAKTKSIRGIEETKNMSFTSQGVVSGQRLISTSVSADRGIMEATFYGAGAERVGGVYDVTISGDRITDVFTAAQGENNSIRKVLPPQ
ncbi:MAG: transferrin-binding protein-like solute binding protein [Cellvibrionaceae bacterium]